MYKLSVIIPVYNVESYLRECLDSVISQSLNNIEIICIDDGSTDNSLLILEEYAAKDNRIKIISKENGGQASARNLGIKEARGRYIAFVDSDDFIKHDMFEKLYSRAIRNNLDLVMCKIALYDNDDGSINENAWYYKLGVFDGFGKEIFNHEDTLDFTCEISVTPYNKIYKKSLLWDNDILFPEGLIFEDEKFFYDVYLRAKRISLVDEFLYYYRVNRKGSTVDISKENDYSDLIPIYKLVRESFIETGNYENYKILLANRLIHLLFSRFTQTSKKFQENYFNLMKEDLTEVLFDEEIFDNLDFNIKSRVVKLLNSSDFDEFKELDEYKEFSVVIACYNCGRYIEETIKSILNQNFSFESNIQIVLVDDGSVDNTAEICNKYVNLYPDNIVYVHQENQGRGAARNLGLKYVKGKYVNFLDSDDKFSGDTFKKVFEFFEKHYDEVDLVSVPLFFFDLQHGEHSLNYKYSKDLVVTLEDYWDYPQLSASSAFFKKELFDEFKFDTELVNSEDSLMINQILLRKQCYGVVSDAKYWYRKRVDGSSTIDGATSKKGFYIDRVNNYFKKLIDDSIESVGSVPRFIQYLIVYDLQWMLRVKDVTGILSVDEIKELYDGIQEVLSYTEDRVILQLKHDSLNLKNHMLALKHGSVSVNSDGSVVCGNISSKFNGDFLGVYAGDVVVDRLHIHKFGLDIVEIKENTLLISGYLVSFFRDDEIQIGALKVNNDEGSEEFFAAKHVYYPNREKKFLNCVLESPYDFDLAIPLKDHENSTIKLKVEYIKDKSINLSYQLQINFHKNIELQYNKYLIYGDYVLKYKDNCFKVIKYNDHVKYLFSVVIACYNCGRYIEETIKSILNQNFSFESNIQIVLVDDGSVDNTAEICNKYVNLYPDNIVYVHQENQGRGAARNLGLKYVKGKYVNFLDSDDKFSGDTFKKVFEFFEKHYDEVDLVSVPLFFFDLQHGEHSLNYKYSKDLVVTLEDYWDYPQLSASSAFFKKELFDEFKFDTELVNSEDSLMINQILLRKQCYGVVSDAKYWYRKRVDGSSTIDGATSKKGFYIDRVNNYFKKLIDDSIESVGSVPRFIQYLIVYDLQWMLRVKDVTGILSVDEIKELYDGIQEVLSYTEDRVILQLKHDSLNLKNHMLALKHGSVSVNSDGSVVCGNISSKFNGDFLGVYAGDVVVDRLHIHKFGLDIVEIKENTLLISGYLVSFFRDDEIQIGALKVNNDEGSEEFFAAKHVYYPNREKKFLNCVLESPYDFDLAIPLKDHENSTIKLKVEYIKDKSINLSYQLDLDFNDYVRLSKKSTYSVSRNYILEYKNNNFNIHNYSYLKMVKLELSMLKFVYKSKEPFYTSVLAFRLTYLLLYPFFRKKRIWLFMDRQESADDNAEHLYKYAINQNDGIKKYFTVSKDSDDFERLSSIKNIIPFYSIKHRLIYLFAEKIISSHPDEIILNPFMGKNIRLYSGLINSDKIFLQHGVTKDNISSWLRKYDKNLSLLVTVSELERESFLETGYNYNESVIQVLGFPRFDNLFELKENNINSSVKQIVIMPSWREELHNKTHAEIKASEYFKHMNSLINNKKLIDIAKSYNYKILFKPHPLVYNFIELFDKNDYISIDYGTKYQDLFRDCNLMVTDYSSVAFDFSYMKKPVIYYQYGDDYNFKEGYFDYETMGFGEVLKDEDNLISCIENYLISDCKMKSEYEKRVDNFYRYNDKNNCKRVYNAISDLKYNI